jgi:hypothetical protein
MSGEWQDDRLPDPRDDLDAQLSSGRNHRWKQDQADIDRERYDALYGPTWEPGDETE